MGEPKYACAWCPKRFVNRWDRESHEGACPKAGFVPVKPATVDPLPEPTPPDLLSGAVWPSSIDLYKSAYDYWTKPLEVKPSAELLLMRFDKVVDHLLNCLRSTKDPTSIEQIANALEKVIQSKDVFPQEEK